MMLCIVSPVLHRHPRSSRSFFLISIIGSDGISSLAAASPRARRKRRQTILSTFVHLAVFEWGTVLSMGRADADGERARRA